MAKRRIPPRQIPAPEGLTEWMDLVNSVPPGIKLPYAPPGELRPGAPGVVSRWVSEYRRAAGESSALAGLFGGITEENFHEVNERYETLLEARDILLAVAESAGRGYYAGEPPSKTARPPARLFRLRWGHMKFGEGWRAEYVPHPLFRVLEGADARRVRACVLCSRIFWAGRFDKVTCNGRCAGALRGRRHRERVGRGRRP